MPPEGIAVTTGTGAAASPAGAKPAAPAQGDNGKNGAGAPAGDAAAQAAEREKANQQRFAEVTRIQADNLNLSRTNKTLQQKLDSMENAGKNLEVLRSEAKTNPLKVMKELGLDFREVADFVINSKDGAPDPIKEQLDTLLKRDEERNRKEEERERQAAETQKQQRITEAKAALATLIDKEEGAELLKVYQSSVGQSGADLVFDIMVDYYGRTGQALDEATAIQAAEDWLGNHAETLALTPKMRARLKAKADEEAKAAQEAETAAKASGRGGSKKPTDDQGRRTGAKPGPTLSNRDTAATSATEASEEPVLPGTKAWDKKLAKVIQNQKAQ